MTQSSLVLVSLAISVPAGAAMMLAMLRQCRKPTGVPGVWIARTMNRSHAELTAWALKHVRVGRGDTVLDIGCGGGMTVQTLSQMADLGMVYGVDYAGASVRTSREFNRAAIEAGRVGIVRATVSRLPFAGESFDVVTAVETHYYWPDYDGDMREVRRVIRPGGSLAIVAEMHGGHRSGVGRFAMRRVGAVLSVDEHRELFVNAGFEDVQVFLEDGRGWICVTGRKKE